MTKCYEPKIKNRTRERENRRPATETDPSQQYLFVTAREQINIVTE